MNKDLRQLIYISLAISAPILLAYPLRFILLGSGISSNPGDWGTFGDYIGGTLGTFASMAAFVAIILTLRTQRDTLELQRNQSELQELQRLLSTTASSIDAILTEVLPFSDSYLPQFKRPIRFQFLIALLAGSVTAEGPGAIKTKDHEALANTRYPWLVVELESLALCLQHYRKASGAEFIELHYRRRYEWCVGALYLLGILNNEVVRAHFNPEAFLRTGSPWPLE